MLWRDMYVLDKPWGLRELMFTQPVIEIEVNPSFNKKQFEEWIQTMMGQAKKKKKRGGKKPGGY